MLEDARQAGEVGPVGLQPLGQGEQVGLADTVGLAHHPGPGRQAVLDDGESIGPIRRESLMKLRSVVLRPE